MGKILCLLIGLSGCMSSEKEKQVLFPTLNISDDEWATYEGRWLTKGGIIHFELS